MTSAFSNRPAPTRRMHVLIHVFLALAFLMGVASAHAQPVGSATTAPTDGPTANTGTQGWGLRVGYNSDYRKIALVYETPTWWSYQSHNGWGRLDLGAELGVSYWKAEHRDPDSMWQLSAIPMLRWWPNETFYAEAGVGPTVLSRTRFAGKEFGSAFQFGDHVGLGMVINRAHRIGVRYSHFSNAGIKKPNPGLDVVQLTYTYQY